MPMSAEPAHVCVIRIRNSELQMLQETSYTSQCRLSFHLLGREIKICFLLSESKLSSFTGC
jgi:hypothetical protein